MRPPGSYGPAAVDGTAPRSAVRAGTKQYGILVVANAHPQRVRVRTARIVSHRSGPGLPQTEHIRRRTDRS